MAQKGLFSILIEQLMALPGIGRKSAQRLAFFILKMPGEEAKRIGQAIIDVKDQVSFCGICNNIAEKEICSICSSLKRETQKVLVVEEPSTLYAIERTGEYKGLYHVLLGGLSPLPGKTTPEPPFQSLVDRVEKGGISEVILATNPTIEGEATAIYITRLLKPHDVTVTRIACGIPVGIDLEYVDEVTLIKSLQGRRVIEQS
ncbi:MAG: recombination mediator RecR [Nitrospira sp.]|nr:recombination protein RecR [Candidatus Manganitrophaceae bacterium]HIL34476.1 recombination protein RecR [Candidatus Manganitrophaceae bacterium]